MHARLILTISGVVAQTAAAAKAPKIIIDNDWNLNAYITFLLAIDAGWEVLGLVSDTANTWSRQASLHALALLEIGGMSCIPVHKGSDYPLLNTPELFQAWEMLYGALPFVRVPAVLLSLMVTNSLDNPVLARRLCRIQRHG